VNVKKPCRASVVAVASVSPATSIPMAARRHRPRIEAAEPAWAGPATQFVIAAHEEPGRRSKRRRRRREEVGIPGGRVLSEGAAPAAAVPSRTRLLPVQVVADLDDHVRMPPGDALRHAGERPRPWVVAGLEAVHGLEPAAGVAHDHDPARAASRQGQPLTRERNPSGVRWQRALTRANGVPERKACSSRCCGRGA
jgi:hypothetical protein